MTNFSGWMAGAKELGRAKYRAQQVPGAVVIFAEGWHPTAGYQDFFEQSAIDVYPPQFTLWQVPPNGGAAQQVTPFVIWVMFGASETVETVTVTDAGGEQQIKVKQTPDVVVSKSQRTWVYGSVLGGVTPEEGSGEGAFGGEQFFSAAAKAPAALNFGEPAAAFTTLRLGEEDPPLTTLRLGEEDPPTTLIQGEEGHTTLALGEEEGAFGGPEGGNPFGGF